jgi:hypothetical protein
MRFKMTKSNDFSKFFMQDYTALVNIKFFTFNFYSLKEILNDTKSNDFFKFFMQDDTVLMNVKY